MLASSYQIIESDFIFLYPHDPHDQKLASKAKNDGYITYHSLEIVVKPFQTKLTNI